MSHPRPREFENFDVAGRDLEEFAVVVAKRAPRVDARRARQTQRGRNRANVGKRRDHLAYHRAKAGERQLIVGRADAL